MLQILASLYHGDLTGFGYEELVFDEGEYVRKVSQPSFVTAGAVVAEHLGEGNPSEIPSHLESFYDSEEAFEMAVEAGASLEFFGYPFFGDEMYIQDKVTPFEQRFQQASIEEQKGLVQEYVDTLKETIGYGFYDESWKVQQNTGINDEGEMVQLDLGDLCFDRDRIIEDLQNEEWRTPYVTRMDDEIGSYLENEIDEVDVEFVENNWGMQN